MSNAATVSERRLIRTLCTEQDVSEINEKKSMDSVTRGKTSKTSKAPNKAKTPSNLLGIERKIA